MHYQNASESARSVLDTPDSVMAEQVQKKINRLRSKVGQLENTVWWRTFILVAVIVGLLALFLLLGREHQIQSIELKAELESDFENMNYGISYATRHQFTQAFYIGNFKFPLARKPIWGIAALPRQLFVLHENVDSIYVYNIRDTNLSYQMSLEVPGLIEPIDMVSSEELVSVFISDWKKSAVFRIDKFGDVTFWSVGEKPHGLAMDLNNNILVTCPVVGVIKIFTPAGKPVDEIHLEPDIINPWHAIQVSDRQLAVTHGSDSDEVNRVCIVDMKSGKTQHCLRRFLVPLSAPTRLAIIAGHIVVADDNNRRLLMFTDDLKYMWTLTTELRGAMRLATDTTNQRLFVAVNKQEETPFVNGEITLFGLI